MKKLKSTTVYSIIIALVMAAFGVLSLYGRGESGFYQGIFSEDKIADVTNSWTDAKGRKAELGDLRPDKGTDHKSIYLKLPENLGNNEHLILVSDNIEQISFYVGDKRIYVSHPQVSTAWLQLTPKKQPLTSEIMVPKKYAGQTARLYLSGIQQASGQIFNCRLGSSGRYLSDYLKNNTLLELLDVVIILLGLTTFILTLTAPLIDKMRSSLRYFAESSILFGLWQLQLEYVPAILYGHFRIWRLFNYPVLMVLPYLLIMVINAQLEQPRKGYAAFGFALSMIDVAYVAGSWLLFKREMSDAVPVFQLVFAIAFVFDMLVSGIDLWRHYARKRAEKETKPLILDDFEAEKQKAKETESKLMLPLHWLLLAGMAALPLSAVFDLYQQVATHGGWIGYPALRLIFFCLQVVVFRQLLVSELAGMQHKGQDDTYLKMVNYDQLTGLYSEYYLTKKLNARRQASVSFMPTIVYFNLAKFKLYNVINGHEAGDECLKKVAQVLTEIFGSENMARFGNDHFVVISADEDQTIKNVQKANEAVSKLDPSFKLYLKAGIYYSDGTESIDTEYDYAKTACDEVKEGAKKCYQVYTAEFSEKAEYTKFVVDHIDDAIKNGDVEVFFQPQVHLMDGKLSGLEALARWNDQNRGFMSPGRFVPILEDSNLTYKLDMYVLEEAAKLIKRRMAEGKPMVPVSFNLSRTDFVTTNPNQILVDLTKRYDIPREMLRVEITETILTEDPVKIKRAIDQFHKDGFQVLMDDFGSGASSLNTLKEYGFDEIKLDMIFMRNFDENSEKVIRPLISMAKSLNVHTLCEGVESERQLAFLKDIGCEVVQGYYYGKPNNFSEVEEHLEDMGVEWENSDENSFFETVGLVDVNSDQPLALLAYGQGDFSYYYMNAGFRSFAAQIGITLQDKHQMDWSDEDLQRQLAAFASVAQRSDHEQIAALTSAGETYRLRFKLIVRGDKHAMFKVTLLGSQNDAVTEGKQAYEKLPLPYVIVRPYYTHSEIGAEAEFVGVNRAFCQQVGLTKNELLGKKLTEVLPGDNPQWVKLPLAVLQTGRASSLRLYSKAMESWAEFTLIPAETPGCVAYAFTKIAGDSSELKRLKQAPDVAAQASILAWTLNGPEDHVSQINFSLAEVASLLEPDRVYLLTNHGGAGKLEYEWTKKQSLLGRISDRLSQALIGYLEQLRAGQPYLYISNMESLRFDRELYELTRKNIRILLVPLFKGQELLGYLGVENFEADRLAYAKDLLAQYTQYLSSKLATIQRMSELAAGTPSDHLTGLGNQTAYEAKLAELKEAKIPAGLLYTDLYGLRDFNVDHGPQEGNLLLQQTADLLNGIFPAQNLYRVGGEIFVAVLPQVSQEAFAAKQRELQAALAKSTRIHLLVTGKLCDYPKHIQQAAKQLDQALADLKAGH